MNYASLPAPVLAKLLALDEAVEVLTREADAVQHDIEDRRARRYGNVYRADDNPRVLDAELQKLLADQNVLRERLHSEQSVLSSIKLWLDRLPAAAKLEPVTVSAEGKDLTAIRDRIKTVTTEMDRLKRAPAPSTDIEARVRDYVAKLAPTVQGVGADERLSIVWGPGAQQSSTFLQERTCDPLALLAALFPDRLIALAMSEVERMANDPLPIAERPPRIAVLDRELEELSYIEEALVVAAIMAGRAVHRSPSVPPAAVLGVRIKN
jgi:hypothetical protein